MRNSPLGHSKSKEPKKWKVNPPSFILTHKFSSFAAAK